MNIERLDRVPQPSAPPAPPPSAPPAPPPSPSIPAIKGPAERAALLAQAIARMVPAGYRVESQAGAMAVMVKGKPVNHLLHFIITIFTVGFWLPVWGAIVIFGGEKRHVVQVDDYGNVLNQQP